MIDGACNYHWAVHLKLDGEMWWVEQQGMGGPIVAWTHKQDLLDSVYKRRDENGPLLYVPCSDFEFESKL
jgi:hypothetical protein